MNPEIKKKWIAALRTGEYKQGKGVLRDRDDNFCCLGVLCDIYKDDVGGVEWKYRPINPLTADFSKDGYQLMDFSGAYIGFSHLPFVVRKWADIDSDGGEYDNKNNLSNDNDRGQSFLQIADIIEKKF